MREGRSMRFQTRIFLTVICVALVPIILCFALLLPMMVSTSAKRQEETARAQLAGMTRQLTEAFSGMERALDALVGMNGCVWRSRRATRRTREQSTRRWSGRRRRCRR